MDWNNRPDVERIPGNVSAAWLVKATRIQAGDVIPNAPDVTSKQSVERTYPSLPLGRARRMIVFPGSPRAEARLMRTRPPRPATNNVALARRRPATQLLLRRAHHPTAEPP